MLLNPPRRAVFPAVRGPAAFEKFPCTKWVFAFHRQGPPRDVTHLHARWLHVPRSKGQNKPRREKAHYPGFTLVLAPEERKPH